MGSHAPLSARAARLLTLAVLALPAGCETSADDDDGEPDAGALAGGGGEADAAADDGGSSDPDAGHEGLVAYGREWLTPEEREARRSEERLEVGWDFEEKTACGAFMIYATAALDQIDEICGVADSLYRAYYEVAGLNNVQWLEEGMACYFGTSVVQDGELQLGVPDVETYPVWWMPSWDVRSDHIPLSAIVSGQGGPEMDQYFNDYYLHWWTLVHFLVHADEGAYRASLVRMLDRRLRLVDFEAEVADIESVEAQWIDYVAALEY